jgi:hypothetical protein
MPLFGSAGCAYAKKKSSLLEKGIKLEALCLLFHDSCDVLPAMCLMNHFMCDACATLFFLRFLLLLLLLLAPSRKVLFEARFAGPLQCQRGWALPGTRAPASADVLESSSRWCCGFVSFELPSLICFFCLLSPISMLVVYLCEQQTRWALSRPRSALTPTSCTPQQGWHI